MCVIAIKPKGLQLQEKEILQRCFTANRDGAGYMYVDSNHQVVIKKGFMEFESFYKALTKDYKENKLDNQNLVMHFRIGTSGKNKVGCTHPFPITNNMKQLELTRFKTNIGICHNGIISQFNSYTAEFSDTELYISTVLTPIIKLNLQAYKFKDVQNLILKTTTSKWTILDKNDECYTIGAFIKDNGYLYSNETFKPVRYVYTHTPVNYSKTYSQYNDDEEETLDAASNWYDNMFKTQKQLENKSSKIIVDEEEYQALEIDNVICATATIQHYTKMMEYFEVPANNQYYFDKDYNIYLKYKGKNGDVISKIAKEAVIYEDETIGRRVSWGE